MGTNNNSNTFSDKQNQRMGRVAKGQNNVADKNGVKNNSENKNSTGNYSTDKNKR